MDFGWEDMEGVGVTKEDAVNKWDEGRWAAVVTPKGINWKKK